MPLVAQGQTAAGLDREASGFADVDRKTLGLNINERRNGGWWIEGGESDGDGLSGLAEKAEGQKEEEQSIGFHKDWN